MKTITIAMVLVLLGTSSLAFAKKNPGHPTAQTHHCQLNGTEVPKAKKACLKAGGTWAIGAPATAKPAAPGAPPAAAK
jgi:hypothetical protein